MIEAHFDFIRSKILKELSKAKISIVVAVYWFTNQELFDELKNKINSGIKVDIIIHNDYINNREAGLNFQSIIDIGGNFFFSSNYNPMHNKFCIIDEKVLINGSYNWTYYAETRNRENILIIKRKKSIVRAFFEEFNKLKSLSEQVDKIRPLTRFEVDENNLLGARDYLANDIIYKAKVTGNKEIVESAFQISPQNIEIQIVAFNLNLTKKRRLIHSIGASLKDDRYLTILSKGSMIPFSSTEVVQTVEDNQTSCSSTIYYGENPKASLNSKMGTMKVYNIPPKPAGEAKLKYHASIDIYGRLKIEKYSLDTGSGDNMTKNLTEILEEVD